MKLTIPTHKRPAALLTGIVLAAFGLSACGTAAEGETVAARNSSLPLMPSKHVSASPSGTIRYSDWQFPDTLNPLQTTEAVSFATINSLIGSPLIYNHQGKLVPYMVTAVPSEKNGMIREGGKLIILKLRPGQKWSNGREITNKDIKFGWQVYMDPASGPACAGTCDHIARIDLKGKYEAQLRMKDSYAGVLAYGLPPVLPHFWARLGTTPHTAAVKLATDKTFNYRDASYLTNGPYQVEQFVQNDRIVLKPNPHYRGPGAAFANRLIFAFYSSKSGMMAAAARGDTDMTTNYTMADLKQLRQQAKKYKVHQIPSFTIEHLEFNSLDRTYKGKPNPLVDPRVRQALALAIDRVAVVRAAFGVDKQTAKQVVAFSPLIVTPNFVQPYGDTALKGQWDPIARKYLPYGTQAVADARKLLAQAGYPNGFELDFVTTTGNTVRQAQASAISKYWQAIGVRTNLTFIPATTLFADWGGNGTLAHGKFQAAMFAFIGGADPDLLKANMMSGYVDRLATNHSAVNGNYAGIRDRAIDRAFERGATSFKDPVRRAAYRQMQQRMNQQAYWVPLYSRPAIDTSSNRLLGFASNPTLAGPTWNTFAWRVQAQ